MLRSHNAPNVEQSSESRRIMSFLYFRYVDSHWKMIINVRENRVFVINSQQRILHTVSRARGQGSRYYIAIYRPKFAWITPNQLVNNPSEGLSHSSTDLTALKPPWPVILFTFTWNPPQLGGICQFKWWCNDNFSIRVMAVTLARRSSQSPTAPHYSRPEVKLDFRCQSWFP